MIERFLCGKPQNKSFLVIISGAATFPLKKIAMNEGFRCLIKHQKSFSPHFTATHGQGHGGRKLQETN